MVIRIQDYLARKSVATMHASRRRIALGGSRGRSLQASSSAHRTIALGAMPAAAADPLYETPLRSTMDIMTLYAEASLV